MRRIFSIRSTQVAINPQTNTTQNPVRVSSFGIQRTETDRCQPIPDGNWFVMCYLGLAMVVLTMGRRLDGAYV
jgi:hypothetical protein